ncbi:MAG: transcriptional regulator, partial [Betaproteobacteria bacterium]
MHIRLLGPLSVRRDGAELALPASRKVRALIAYLALAPRAVSRSRLCELLWDVPNDPRGELRWCLSKMRHVLDEP